MPELMEVVRDFIDSKNPYAAKQTGLPPKLPFVPRVEFDASPLMRKIE